MKGTNFKPGTTATFTLHSDPVVLGTAVVTADGTVSLTTKVPATVLAGVHHVIISGTGTNGEAAEARIELTVAAAGSTTTASSEPTAKPSATSNNAEGDLATTGAGSTPFLLGGLMLLLAGAVVIISRRKRNSSHA